MKIKILGNPITPFGSFDNGQILTDEKHSKEFLNHLIEAGAACCMDKEAYETKVIEVEAVKKPQSSPSSPQAKASRKKTSKKQNKRKS